MCSNLPLRGERKTKRKGSREGGRQRRDELHRCLSILNGAIPQTVISRAFRFLKNALCDVSFCCLQAAGATLESTRRRIGAFIVFCFGNWEISDGRSRAVRYVTGPDGRVRTVRYGTDVRYRTVPYGTVPYRTVPYRYSTVRYSTLP